MVDVGATVCAGDRKGARLPVKNTGQAEVDRYMEKWGLMHDVRHQD